MQEGLSELQHSTRLRPAVESDEEFLIKVFASTRNEELAALSWNPDLARSFITMQFNAQRQSNEGRYPGSQNSVVLLDEEPIGRILVDRTGDEIVLIDIAILPEHRNAGIGGVLLRDLLQEAETAGKQVRLSIFLSNPAIRLYQRLGFSTVSSDGAYAEMTWSASASLANIKST